MFTFLKSLNAVVSWETLTCQRWVRCRSQCWLGTLRHSWKGRARPQEVSWQDSPFDQICDKIHLWIRFGFRKVGTHRLLLWRLTCCFPRHRLRQLSKWMGLPPLHWSQTKSRLSENCLIYIYLWGEFSELQFPVWPFLNCRFSISLTFPRGWVMAEWKST